MQPVPTSWNHRRTEGPQRAVPVSELCLLEVLPHHAEDAGYEPSQESPTWGAKTCGERDF